MSIRTAVVFSAALAALCCAACGPAATLQTPDGFARLDEGGEYAYRAATAEGVVVGVRAMPNSPEGDLDFWVRAVDRHLQTAGYAPDEHAASVEVKTGKGLSGRQLRYTREVGGRAQSYCATVFVRGDKVIVVEAGGDASHIDGTTKARIDRAIATLDV